MHVLPILAALLAGDPGDATVEDIQARLESYYDSIRAVRMTFREEIRSQASASDRRKAHERKLENFVQMEEMVNTPQKTIAAELKTLKDRGVQQKSVHTIDLAYTLDRWMFDERSESWWENGAVVERRHVRYLLPEDKSATVYPELRTISIESAGDGICRQIGVLTCLGHSFNLTPSLNLADLLAASQLVRRDGVETLDGISAEVLTVGPELNSVELGSHAGDSTDWYRLWLAPSLGWLPLRYDYLMPTPKGTVSVRSPGRTEREPTFRCGGNVTTISPPTTSNAEPRCCFHGTAPKSVTNPPSMTFPSYGSPSTQRHWPRTWNSNTRMAGEWFAATNLRLRRRPPLPAAKKGTARPSPRRSAKRRNFYGPRAIASRTGRRPVLPTCVGQRSRSVAWRCWRFCSSISEGDRAMPCIDLWTGIAAGAICLPLLTAGGPSGPVAVPGSQFVGGHDDRCSLCDTLNQYCENCTSPAGSNQSEKCSTNGSREATTVYSGTPCNRADLSDVTDTPCGAKRQVYSHNTGCIGQPTDDSDDCTHKKSDGHCINRQDCDHPCGLAGPTP